MKKSFVIALSLLLMIMIFPGTAFATELSAGEKITTVDELEEAIQAQLIDGTLSETARESILAETEEGVLEAYISEKMEAAFLFAETLDEEINMRIMPNGTTYARNVYDLGDGCTLIMEFEDGEDGLKNFVTEGMITEIKPMASNGETLWKSYGNRYFTAKVSVNVGIGAGSLSLENHYILSSQGIDENYGTADGTPRTGTSYVEVGSVVITDASARTVGASDVNMNANFKIVNRMSGTIVNSTNKTLATSVGYVAHNYSAQQIQVKHSWSLS